MQRFLFLKFVSQNPSNPISSLQSISSTCSSKTSHFSPSRHFFSHSTSSSSASNSWRSPNSISQRIHLFLSNPIMATRGLLTTTILKGSTSKGRIDFSRFWYRRVQLPKSSFHPIRLLHVHHNRIWKSSWLRRISPDNVVLGLILANAAVFMLWRIADQRFMMKNFMISLDNVKSGRVHTLITSAFSHIETGHLISNMIGLYFFGTSIGRNFGTEYFLKLYLSGAVVGSVFFLIQNAFLSASSTGGMNTSRTPGLGASGAVNAVMLLDIFLFPKKTLLLDFFIPVPAILLGIYIIGKDMLTILEGNSHISGSAHLGGAAVAAVAWAQLRRGRRLF